MMLRRKFNLIICWLLPVFIGIVLISQINKLNPGIVFNGKNAMKYLNYQVSKGPRIPGSSSHQQIRQWIVETMTEQGWIVEIQEGIINGEKVFNIIAKISDKPPRVIIGAHYDSREFADREKIVENQKMPVLGANDGASGVAVILELGRIIPKNNLLNSTWLLFFDYEDNGGIEGRDWLLGSRYFVQHLKNEPEKVIIIDMVGDQDLQIYRERNSDQELSDEVWTTADNLGYSGFFIGEKKFQIYDDHIPFLEAGIRAIDVIDFDYPYWHTMEDTINKVSSNSLKVVGDTIFHWLITQEEGVK